ncbi:MAG: hypothetical protein SFU86_14335 [Pirellulaceae bacterium]|nr:hypothetical protein [Pirellulaceae bacterium]
MSVQANRRQFLSSAAAAGTLAGMSQLDFLAKLPRVSAAEAKPHPKMVRLADDIEPLVRLLEETPRERLLEEVAARIQRGTTYREVIAALLLAGVRNVQPRPSVGFKFHAVLVVNSAHLASLSSPDEHRWLPIFWALDQFKSGQAADEREGNWTMPPVDEARVPPAHQARSMFTAALDNWDEAAADVSIAALARSASSNELFEIFARYGCRDFRSIGHKAIYVANAWRTLDCIGWQYAEPVLRSLAYALLNHEGDGNPAQNDFEADRHGRANVPRAKQLRDDWRQGKLDDGATRELLATIYSGTADELCDQVVATINGGASLQTVWDALLVGSGELLMRQPGIVGLHTLTSTNALRYAWQTAADDETRRLILLQNAAFLPLFRQAMEKRGKVGEQKLTSLEPAEIPADSAAALDAIFWQVGGNRQEAARQTLAYARVNPQPHDFITRARTLVFLKGRDSHDYKFSSAVLEDFGHVSPAWRDRFLAASVFNLRGSGEKDNPLVERTREALA